jgi:2-(1,2-epoxy-1,2-dihydrophenyl)acetyl-CoA isomerase
LIEVQSFGSVVTIRLNRPEQFNALVGGMREDLLSAIEAAASDPAVRALILTGAGRGFCSGGDRRRLGQIREAEDVGELARLLDLGRRIVLALRSCPKPVIAAINGAAAGAGLSLALACDLRLAADSATFSSAFVKLGLVPDWGCTWLLTRLVGPGRAIELAWSGRKLGAAEALSLGLVHHVIPDAELAGEARRVATELAAAPASAVAGIKALVLRSEASALETQLLEEKRVQLDCFRSADVLERLRGLA